MKLREAVARARVKRFLSTPYDPDWTTFRFRLALARVLVGFNHKNGKVHYGMDERNRSCLGSTKMGRGVAGVCNSDRLQRAERLAVRNRCQPGQQPEK